MYRINGKTTVIASMVIVTALLLIVAINDPRENECDSATAHVLTRALINIYYLKWRRLAVRLALLPGLNLLL